MDVVVENSAGIDVHKEQVTVCVLRGAPGKPTKKETRVFSTFTGELVKLAEWLHSLKVTSVGMESTGVYWKPVHAVLEAAEGFELVVGNAQHMKNVPGRKTDVKDAEWIAQLLRHGLIKKSFVPPPDIRELRDVVRYRKTVRESRSAERNRLQKLLESANVKLGSVVSDVFGMTGMAIVKALVSGESDPAKLMELAHGNLRAKKQQLRAATECRIEPHHRWVLSLQLAHLEHLDALIASLDENINQRVEPYRAQMTLLETIPGVGATGAASILAETGADMSIFPTSGQLAAWGGVCPGNNESAGKRFSTPTRKGNPYLRCALIEAATSAVRTKDSFYREAYYRMGSRMPRNKAKVAIAHKIAKAIHAMLKTGTCFEELGPAYADRVDKSRTANKLVKRLKSLGYSVSLAAPPTTQGEQNPTNLLTS
jgi:transposase